MTAPEHPSTEPVVTGDHAAHRGRRTMPERLAARVVRQGLVVAVVGFTVVPGLLHTGSTGQASLPVATWVQRADAVCRPPTNTVQDLTVPASVAHGRYVTTADVRTAGSYYQQLGRLDSAVARQLRDLPGPAGQADAASGVVQAVQGAAQADGRVYTASRSRHLRMPQDGAAIAQTVAAADTAAAGAGESTQELAVVDCLLLFGGDNADHQNLPKGPLDGPPCWNDPNYTNETILNPTDVPCDGPHGFETYGVASYPTGSDNAYPGDAAMNRAADILCAVRFKTFVGIDPSVSALSVLPVTPAPDDWNSGDHTIDCALHNTEDQPLVGSMRDARR